MQSILSQLKAIIEGNQSTQHPSRPARTTSLNVQNKSINRHPAVVVDQQMQQHLLPQVESGDDCQVDPHLLRVNTTHRRSMLRPAVISRFKARPLQEVSTETGKSADRRVGTDFVLEHPQPLARHSRREVSRESQDQKDEVSICEEDAPVQAVKRVSMSISVCRPSRLSAGERGKEAKGRSGKERGDGVESMSSKPKRVNFDKLRRDQVEKAAVKNSILVGSLRRSMGVPERHLGSLSAFHHSILSSHGLSSLLSPTGLLYSVAAKRTVSSLCHLVRELDKGKYLWDMLPTEKDRVAEEGKKGYPYRSEHPARLAMSPQPVLSAIHPPTYDSLPRTMGKGKNKDTLIDLKKLLTRNAKAVEERSLQTEKLNRAADDVSRSGIEERITVSKNRNVSFGQRVREVKFQAKDQDFNFIDKSSFANLKQIYFKTYGSTLEDSLKSSKRSTRMISLPSRKKEDTSDLQSQDKRPSLSSRLSIETGYEQLKPSSIQLSSRSQLPPSKQIDPSSIPFPKFTHDPSQLTGNTLAKAIGRVQIDCVFYSLTAGLDIMAGKYLIETNKPKRALPLLARALNVAILFDDLPLALIAYYLLGEYYHRIGNDGMAVVYYGRAVMVGIEVGDVGRVRMGIGKMGIGVLGSGDVERARGLEKVEHSTLFSDPTFLSRSKSMGNPIIHNDRKSILSTHFPTSPPPRLYAIMISMIRGDTFPWIIEENSEYYNTALEDTYNYIDMLIINIQKGMIIPRYSNLSIDMKKAYAVYKSTQTKHIKRTDYRGPFPQTLPQSPSETALLSALPPQSHRYRGRNIQGGRVDRAVYAHRLKGLIEDIAMYCVKGGGYY